MVAGFRMPQCIEAVPRIPWQEKCRSVYDDSKWYDWAGLNGVGTIRVGDFAGVRRPRNPRSTARALVGSYIELYNSGNLAIADEVIAAEFVDHASPEEQPGPSGVKRMVASFRAAFPDAVVTLNQMVSEGDTVAFRFAIRGTHLGIFGGIPPTGRQITLTGMDFVRVRDGKIVELWSNQDTLGLLRQLGAI